MPFSPEVREQAKLRARGKCERCGTPLGNNWECHHKTAEAKGGSDSLSNAQALCIPCHQATTTYGTKT
jgi:5-methylcytosine-specific restriction endonuclease McrA